MYVATTSVGFVHRYASKNNNEMTNGHKSYYTNSWQRIKIRVSICSFARFHDPPINVSCDIFKSAASCIPIQPKQLKAVHSVGRLPSLQCRAGSIDDIGPYVRTSILFIEWHFAQLVNLTLQMACAW